MLNLRKLMLLVLLLLSPAVWAVTTISIWSGNGYPIGNKNAATLEFLYSGRWHYGDNLFFFNVANPTSNDTGINGLWASRLSASKVMHKNFKIGPLSDLLLAGEYVASGQNVREYAIGLGTNWAVPHVKNLSANAYYVHNDSVHGNTYQLEGVWVMPMRLSDRFHVLFSGAMEYYGPITGTVKNLKANFLAEPSLMLDAGRLLHMSNNHLFVGLQYSYWYHMYGSHLTESVPELKLSWVF